MNTASEIVNVGSYPDYDSLPKLPASTIEAVAYDSCKSTSTEAFIFIYTNGEWSPDSIAVAPALESQAATVLDNSSYFFGVSDKDKSLFYFPTRQQVMEAVKPTRHIVRVGNAIPERRTAFVLQSEVISVSVEGRDSGYSSEYLLTLANTVDALYPNQSVAIIPERELIIPLDNGVSLGNRTLPYHLIEAMALRNVSLSQLIKQLAFVIQSGCVDTDPLTACYRIITGQALPLYKRGLKQLMDLVDRDPYHHDKLAVIIDSLYRQGEYNQHGLSITIEA